jgi:hypothetical protein
VQSGNEIILDPFPNVEQRVIRLALLGVVMSVLLNQRGILVLHASAVSLNGTAMAFLGHKEAGKSTLAATLYARGYQLVADDVVAVDISGAKAPMILPAFPQLKLWPEAVAAAVGDVLEAWPQLHSQVEKRGRLVNGRFVRQPVAVGHLYVLEQGASLEIQPLRPQEAMMQLISYSSMARFGRQALAINDDRHFFQCARLARHSQVYYLKRPLGFDLLPAIAQLVDSHHTETASMRRDELPQMA